MSDLKKIHESKLKIVTLAFIFVFLVSIGLLLKWQIFDNQQFIAIANERYKDVKIPSVRGSILARDGSTLAYSEPRFDAYVWLPELEIAEKSSQQTRQEFIVNVSSVLNVKPEELTATLASGPQWIKIADKITLDQRNQLLAIKSAETNNFLQGLQFQYQNKRIYPESQLASQVLGFVGMNNRGDELGQGGLEQYYDGSLRPQEGFETNEIDSFGNLITLSESDPIEAKPGVTLYSTIDKTLQAKLEAKVKQGLEQYKATSASAILMDPKTGAILAMANYPTFDPNNYSQVTNSNALGNKAINTPYEIGSVAKIFTLSSAIDQNKVTPSTVILPNGHNGCEITNPNPPKNLVCGKNKVDLTNSCTCTYDGKPVKRALTVMDALASSDNIGFRHIALTMTYKEFYDYLAKFGLTSITGVDLAGESQGIVKNFQDWNYADQTVYSYGHGYEITPLQTITGIASVANEGKRMQPYIVSKVVDSQGNTKEFNPQIIANVVTPETSKTVSAMLHQVYENQLIEKKYKNLKKYYIGLKSGTALIPFTDRPGYSSQINTTFVGFDASPEHKFILLMKLEKPEVGDLSFYNARLLWLDTFMDIKDYLNVPEYSAN